MKAQVMVSAVLGAAGGKRAMAFPSPPPATTDTITQPARVLLVDDSRGDIILAQRNLLGRNGMGCQLSVATSADEAMEILVLALVGGRPVDLVLLDLNMPGENGFMLLDRIRSHARLTRLPVIICSGSDDEADRRQARFLGAVGYMVKPASLNQLKRFADLLPRLDVVEDEAGTRLTVTRSIAN